jgi:hypothetical protein
VVVGHVLAGQAANVRLVQHNHVIETQPGARYPPSAPQRRSAKGCARWFERA